VVILVFAHVLVLFLLVFLLILVLRVSLGVALGVALLVVLILVLVGSSSLTSITLFLVIVRATHDRSSGREWGAAAETAGDAIDVVHGGVVAPKEDAPLSNLEKYQ
jgi:hypothetical protein